MKIVKVDLVILPRSICLVSQTLFLLQRHRLVNEILKYELEHGVHALSIVAKTPCQWENNDKIVEPSPNCRGGFGK